MPRNTRLRPEDALLLVDQPPPRRRTPLRHVGLRPERQVGDFPQAVRERAFAARWAAENDREQGQTHFLDMILAGLDDARSPLEVVGAGGRVSDRPARLTQRDATIAATLMQWLGTHVGFCFVEESLREAGLVVRRVEDEERERELVRTLQGRLESMERTLAGLDPTAGRTRRRFTGEIFLVTPESDAGPRVTVQPGEPGYAALRNVLLPPDTPEDSAINTTAGTLSVAIEQEQRDASLEAQQRDARAAATEIARVETEAAARNLETVSVRVRPGEPGYAHLTRNLMPSHQGIDVVTSPARLQAAIREEAEHARTVENLRAFGRPTGTIRRSEHNHPDTAEADGFRYVHPEQYTYRPSPEDPSPVQAGAGTTRANLSQARRMRPAPPPVPRPSAAVGPGPGDADDDDPFGEGEVSPVSGAPACPNCGSYAVSRVSPHAEEYRCANCECTDIPLRST